MYSTSPGLLHIEGPSAPAPDVAGPIAIVVEDYQQAVDFLADTPGGIDAGYVVVRAVADVPVRAGGIISLTRTWPEGLAQALSRACGLSDSL